MKKFFIFFIATLFCVINFVGVCIAEPLDISKTFWTNPTKIKTYIPPNHKYTEKMKRACAEWSRMTRDGIVFKYVANPADAQIRVYFVKSIPKSLYPDSAAGLTQSYGDPTGGRLGWAKIWIADYSQGGTKLTNDEVYTAMLHELGHSIGLGHSNNPNSIMYPSTLHTRTMEISKEDLRKLANKYGWNK